MDDIQKTHKMLCESTTLVISSIQTMWTRFDQIRSDRRRRRRRRLLQGRVNTNSPGNLRPIYLKHKKLDVAYGLAWPSRGTRVRLSSVISVQLFPLVWKVQRKTTRRQSAFKRDNRQTPLFLSLSKELTEKNSFPCFKLHRLSWLLPVYTGLKCRNLGRWEIGEVARSMEPQ